jgi:hypothetical protein
MGRYILLVPLMLAMAFGQADAQGAGSVELGFDAGVNIQFIDDDGETEVNLGLPSQSLGAYEFLALQTVRTGFFVTQTGQIETTVGLNFNTFTTFGDNSFTHLGIGAEWLQNIGDVQRSAVPFVKGGGLIKVLANDDEAFSQFGLKGGVGVKLMAATRFAVRFEGGVMRLFETDDFLGHTDLYGNVGVSVFTK